MKTLVSAGVVWIQSSNPFGKSKSHDAWPTHAAGFISYGATGCASGAQVWVMYFELTDGQIYAYLGSNPGTIADADAVETRMESIKDPTTGYAWIGEGWNFVVRPTIISKFTLAQFGDYLNSH